MGFLKWLQDQLNSFNSSAEADLAFRQGVYQRQQEDYQRALEFFDKALELNPKHVSALINRGHVRKQLGDNEGAQRDYEAAYELDPFAASTWVNSNSANLKRPTTAYNPPPTATGTCRASIRASC